MYWENDFKYNVSKVSKIIKGYEEKDCLAYINQLCSGFIT